MEKRSKRMLILLVRTIGKLNKLQKCCLLLSLVIVGACLIGINNYRMNRTVCNAIDDYLVTASGNQDRIRKLVNLAKLDWPNRQNSKWLIDGALVYNYNRSVPLHFQPKVSVGQRAVIRKLLDVLANIMYSNGFGNRFMLHEDTLLGSFQFHDFQPWDDGVHVLMHLSVRTSVWDAVYRLAPCFHIVKDGAADKMYTATIASDEITDLEFSRKSKKHNWGWPYLEISYYEQIGDDIVIVNSPTEQYKRIKANMIFPLVYRPLGRQWYPTPHDIIHVLKQYHTDGNLCRTNGLSRMTGEYTQQRVAPCINLGSVYAFVEHQAGYLALIYRKESANRELVFHKERLFMSGGLKKKTKIFHSICLPFINNHRTKIVYGF